MDGRDDSQTSSRYGVCDAVHNVFVDGHEINNGNEAKLKEPVKSTAEESKATREEIASLVSKIEELTQKFEAIKSAGWVGAKESAQAEKRAEAALQKANDFDICNEPKPLAQCALASAEKDRSKLSQAIYLGAILALVILAAALAWQTKLMRGEVEGLRSNATTLARENALCIRELQRLNASPKSIPSDLTDQVQTIPARIQLHGSTPTWVATALKFTFYAFLTAVLVFGGLATGMVLYETIVNHTTLPRAKWEEISGLIPVALLCLLILLGCVYAGYAPVWIATALKFSFYALLATVGCFLFRCFLLLDGVIVS